jgi:hypothetical protein
MLCNCFSFFKYLNATNVMFHSESDPHSVYIFVCGMVSEKKLLLPTFSTNFTVQQVMFTYLKQAVPFLPKFPARYATNVIFISTDTLP